MCSAGDGANKQGHLTFDMRGSDQLDGERLLDGWVGWRDTGLLNGLATRRVNGLRH